MKETSIKESPTMVVRFAGDSGDGMQITGSQFTTTSALAGNDVQTHPDFPAEIRAPAGTLAGVSGFQLCFSENDIHTAGDQLHALIAMNPAGLKVNVQDLEVGGLLIVNANAFTEKDLQKAHYANNPLTSGELEKFQVFALPITELTLQAIAHLKLLHSSATKCKNMYALGIVFWLFDRPLEPTLTWLAQKFQKKEELLTANVLALKAGYNYALTTELFVARYHVKKATLPLGRYRHITGNEALGLGCVAASVRANRPMLLSGYPITPASAILHQLSHYSHFNIKVFQAEDEIAAVCASVGAAFGGSLAVTCTSGPGFDLKAEGLGLAVMTELPVVVIDVQRAGPSTGMPTKTEQGDLLTAMYGRHGECPVPLLAPASPKDCFMIMLEAFRIALKYMTPVIVLSDTSLANGAEPWQIPAVDELPDLTPTFYESSENFSPFMRHAETLARVWALPGTPGCEHRLGGLEKDQATGNVSYDPHNHEAMVKLRREKVLNIARDIPELEIFGKEKGKVLVVSWGSTYGAVRSAVEILQAEGESVSMIHLRHVFPFPQNLGKILKQFDKVLVPELNLGQLVRLLRAEFLVDAQAFNKVTGKPFLIQEIREKILELNKEQEPRVSKRTLS